jgi:hypothetical protein
LIQIDALFALLIDAIEGGKGFKNGFLVWLSGYLHNYATRFLIENLDELN